MIFNRFFGEKIPVKSIPPDENKREEKKNKKKRKTQKKWRKEKMKENIINVIFSFFGGLVGFLFGEINEIFYILITLIFIDFITGLIKAGFQKKMNSEVCFKGIIKKFFILVIVSLGHLLDLAIGQAICGNVVMFFYIANESISIIENAGIIGLPIPQKIKDILEQLKEKEDADESE